MKTILIILNLIQLIFSNKYYNKKGFGTKIIHGTFIPDHKTGNIIPSITLGTTFAQILPKVKPGKDDPNSYGNGYFYSRQANPTRSELERTLALSENAKHAAVFSSGMAAISTVIELLKYGDHVIASDDLYGGTYSYFKEIATKHGIIFSYINMNDLNKLEKTINSKTKLIWLESLTNPLLKTTNINAIAQIAKNKQCLLAVDATFSSPYLLNPLNLGADIIIHSATKYIGGHSDILMGALICNDNNLINKIRFIQTCIGAVPSPFECYLTMRGLKTLHLRMESSQKNALKIAKFLEKHDLIEKVIYPGLKSYENYELAKKQSKGSGAIVSFYIKGNYTEKFVKSLKIFTLAVSLGAVESLICVPALMTHKSIPKEKREELGLTDNLIRLSVGIENSKDLINDLNRALNKSLE